MQFPTLQKGRDQITKLSNGQKIITAPRFGVYAATSPVLSTIFGPTVHRLIFTHKYATSSIIVRMLAPIVRPNCPPISAERQIRKLIMLTLERKE